MSGKVFNDKFQQGEQPIHNPFDMNGPQINDLLQRRVVPVVVQERVDLSAAGELALNVPGRAFVVYGHDGSTIKTVNTTAYMSVQFNKYSWESNVAGFPAKHARGFRGPFANLVFKWPAQNGVFVDIVIHQYEDHPWIDGESCT